MDRVLAYHELLIRLKQWCRLFEIWTTGRTIFSTAEVISTNEVLKYPLAEIPRSCRYFLSSVTLIALKSALLLWSAILNV